jgi:hypothetical protein
MSSFLCDATTINRILNGLDSNPAVVRRIVHGNESPDLFVESADLDDLGVRMIELNKLALSERYGDEFKANNTVFKFAHAPVSPVQAIKSLQCFLYQCSEGKAVKHELFRRLDFALTSLALKYISDSPAYDAAEWG